MSDYKLHKGALLVAIIFALCVEYYMIVVETFINFQTAYGFWGGAFIYVMMTLITIIIIRALFWHIEAGRFALTYVITLLIVLPIGFFWGLFQGYDIHSQLFNIEWEFTHDMVYTVLVTQFIVLAILLLGTRESDEEHVEQGDERSGWATGWH